MDMTALVKCDDYEFENVAGSIHNGLELIGGIRKYIKPKMKVLLKLNLVVRKKPETCATVHPAVVEALVNEILDAGAYPILGDSPGGPFNEYTLKNVYDTCGIKSVADKTGAELSYDTSSVDVYNEKAVVLKKMTVTRMSYDADVIISVAKLKTHEMVGFTGAVKNLYGTIPGITKAEYHFRMPDLYDFSNMLVDICEYHKPVLSVIDAVYGMEGDGPTAGSPRKIGAFIIGTSPYCADIAAISLTGINPYDISTVKRAAERGLVSAKIDDIKITGEDISELAVKDFKIAKPLDIIFFNGKYNWIPGFIKKSTINYMTPKPKFIYKKCISCGTCFKSCPAHAITMVNKKPHIDYNKCIRCFCCQELCLHKAVKVKRPWILKIIK